MFHAILWIIWLNLVIIQVLFSWIPTFVFKGQSNDRKGLEKDIKMISFTDKSVIEKLQFCWNSGNANFIFKLDTVAALRLVPTTSLQPAYYIMAGQSLTKEEYFQRHKGRKISENEKNKQNKNLNKTKLKKQNISR